MYSVIPFQKHTLYIMCVVFVACSVCLGAHWDGDCWVEVMLFSLILLVLGIVLFWKDKTSTLWWPRTRGRTYCNIVVLQNKQNGNIFERTVGRVCLKFILLEPVLWCKHRPILNWMIRNKSAVSVSWFRQRVFLSTLLHLRCIVF